MRKLQLKVREGCQEPYIEFYVDGQNLGTQLSDACGGRSIEDVLPWYGIDYKISDTVFGEGVRRDGASSAILFACGCCVSACGVVFVRVTVDRERITLSEFSTGGVVVPLAPLIFDRHQFDDAVRSVQRELESWRPSERTGPTITRPTSHYPPHSRHLPHAVVYTFDMEPVVTSNPNVMHGTPCFAGTRVAVESFFDHLEAGYAI